MLIIREFGEWGGRYTIEHLTLYIGEFWRRSEIYKEKNEIKIRV